MDSPRSVTLLVVVAISIVKIPMLVYFPIRKNDATLSPSDFFFFILVIGCSLPIEVFFASGFIELIGLFSFFFC